MKLHEEFKEYENLWEAEASEVKPTAEELTKKYNLSDSVEAALAKYKEPFQIEYDDMIDEWEEDAWDYRAGNHTTVTKSNQIDAFTYELSADEVFDKIVDDFLDEYPILNQLDDTIKRLKKEYWLNDYAERMKPILTELINDYQELLEYSEANEHDDELAELPYIHIADNLEEFFELYYDVFQEECKEEAINSQY